MRTLRALGRGYWYAVALVVLLANPVTADFALDLRREADGWSIWLLLVDQLTFSGWAPVTDVRLAATVRAAVFVVALGVLLALLRNRNATTWVTAVMGGGVASGVFTAIAVDADYEFEPEGAALANGLAWGALFGVLFSLVVLAGMALRSGSTRSAFAPAGTTSPTRRGPGMTGWPSRADENEATRAMCSAGYLDHNFAYRVASLLMTRDLRAIAPSIGVDLKLVLRHHLAAMRVGRDHSARLSLVLVLTIVLSFLSLWFLLIGMVAGVALIVADDLGRRKLIVQRLRHDAFRQQPNPPDEPDREVALRLEEIDEAQRGNVTVFSGYRPWVGYGDHGEGWSFALPVVAPSSLDGKPGAPVPFDAAELTDRVRARLAEAATAPGTTALGPPLRELQVEERVFVNGRSLDERFLVNREPVTSVDITEFVGAVGAVPRHYLCAHVPSWGGQTVASLFFRFTTDGQLLYAECERSALGPVLTRFAPDERTDEMVEGKELLEVVGNAVLRLFPAMLTAPVDLVRALNFRSVCERQASRAEHLAKHDLNFDHGARESVREIAADRNYHTHFQHSDTRKHFKVVERHVLEALTEFLDEHNVDTRELRNRQMTILNEGIIQTGGTSHVGVQAVGKQAAATQEAR